MFMLRFAFEIANSYIQILPTKIATNEQVQGIVFRTNQGRYHIWQMILRMEGNRAKNG
jgi:hypothetical protein